MTQKSTSAVAVEACFKNAKDLLRAARTTLAAERLPHIAFHLALLSLEEVGKGLLIAARQMAIANGDEPTFMDRRLDDHIFKLFWALWTPLFRRGKIDQAEWKQYQGLAKDLHDERLSSLYVGLSNDADTPALQLVTEEKVEWLLRLVEARIGMEETRDWEALDLKPSSDIAWLIQASEDPVRRRQIYGGKSFEKLAEVASMADWVQWLRKEFEEAEAKAAEMLRKEMERELPTGQDPGKDKWQIRVRLYSTAQTVKSSAVNAWNARTTWIKLSTVQNNKFALDVEITLRESFSLDRVPLAGYDVARTMLVALNIGSTGFWWWHLDPNPAPGQYYERFTDLNAPGDKSIGFKMAAPSPLQWERQALREPEFNHVCHPILSGIAGPHQDCLHHARAVRTDDMPGRVEVAFDR